MRRWELEARRMTAGQDRLVLDDGTVFQLWHWSVEPVRYPLYDVQVTPTCGCVRWRGRSACLPWDQQVAKTKRLAYERAYADLLDHYRKRHQDDGRTAPQLPGAQHWEPGRGWRARLGRLIPRRVFK